MQKYIIYVLKDPVTLVPFYVGSTRTSLRQRLAVHMWCAKNRRQGTVSDRINALNQKPLIEALDCDSYDTCEQARVKELYWVNKLNEEGFMLANDCKPFNDYESPLTKLNSDEIEGIKKYSKFLSAICSKHKIKLRHPVLHRIVATGSCRKETLHKIREFLSHAKKLDDGQLNCRHTAAMVRLSDIEIEKIKEWKKGRNLKKSGKETGLHDTHIRRILKSGEIRHDKYEKLFSVIK